MTPTTRAGGGRLRALYSRTLTLVRALSGTPRLTGRRRVALMALAALTCLTIGLVDVVAEDRNVTLDLLYVFPVAGATILVSFSAGMVLAAFGVIAEILEQLEAHGIGNLGSALAEGLLRLVVLGGTVVLLTALRAALEDSQAAELRTRQFIGDAAHQLRTPLAGLRACAEALIMSGVAPEQERALQSLTEESARVGRLSDSIIQLARLDSGVAVHLAEAADVREVCSSAVALTRGQLGDAIVVALRVPQAPVVVRSAAPLREAVVNLLDNARRHARSRIDVNLAVDDDIVTLAISDDGPGLPEGADELVFGRFVSLDAFGGSGLGLAISRALVESQGGSLHYQDGVFVMTLPHLER